MSLLNGFESFVRQAEPLAMHTWFQLGGPAEYFAEPETVEQLVALVQRGHEEGLAMPACWARDRTSWFATKACRAW